MRHLNGVSRGNFIPIQNRFECVRLKGKLIVISQEIRCQHVTHTEHHSINSGLHALFLLHIWKVPGSVLDYGASVPVWHFPPSSPN